MTFFTRMIPTLPRTLWMIIFFSVLLHLVGFGFALEKGGYDGLVWGDGTRYVEVAQNLLDGRGYVYLSPQGFTTETFRTPGLPFLIYPFLFFGLGVMTYLACMTLVSAIYIPYLVWYIARSFFGERVALLSALLITLEPLMLLHSWFAFSDVPFVLFFLSGIALLMKTLERQQFQYVFFSGVLFAISIYIRPAAFPLILTLFVGLGLYALFSRAISLRKLVFVGSITVLLLVPWLSFMHSHTGAWALSATGWRNVYTDYVASIRSIENNTPFKDEKTKLKQYAYATWNLDSSTLDNPSNNPLFKSFALKEIRKHPQTVLKLQSVLFLSYFTHTDYLFRLSKVGFIEKIPSNISPSQVLAREGIAGVGKIYHEMQRKFFIPIIERLWALGILFCAFVGFFMLRSPVRYLILCGIVVGYSTSSAIGLGIEGRLRIPILPFYFMFSSAGILYIVSKLNSLFHRENR